MAKDKRSEEKTLVDRNGEPFVNGTFDRRTNRFVMITRDVVFNEDNGLTSTDIAVFCALSIYFSNGTNCGWPSHKTIANKARVSDRTVRRSIKKLEDAGYIRVVHRNEFKMRKTNEYYAVDDYKHRTWETAGTDMDVLHTSDTDVQ